MQASNYLLNLSRSLCIRSPTPSAPPGLLCISDCPPGLWISFVPNANTESLIKHGSDLAAVWLETHPIPVCVVLLGTALLSTAEYPCSHYHLSSAGNKHRPFCCKSLIKSLLMPTGIFLTRIPKPGTLPVELKEDFC